MAAIDTYAVTSSTAKALRELNKFGLNLADFAALTTTATYAGLGNGSGYTVTNWISDGVFADLAAVQAVYPVCQSGADYVDWVLLQSAIDFMIYDNLNTATRGTTKRVLRIPAGLFVCNRPLLVGYARVGTPPAGLNGNGYIAITIEGEGPNYDADNPGMTGTTIQFTDLTDLGFAVSLHQQVILRQMTVRGPYLGWMANNLPVMDVDYWDLTAYDNGTIADANFILGAALNVGVAVDPYSSAGSAAAYPARVLPSYFGGGTTTAQFSSAGGSGIALEDVNIEGFVVGYGRPHGDSNCEYISMTRGKIKYCVTSFACGHSQNRNVSLREVDFEGFHTAIGNIAGTQNNAEMMGTYENLHFNRGYQIFNHQNSDWSGPVTLRNCYAESVHRIGAATYGQLTLDGGRLSWTDQSGDQGSTHNHFKGKLTIRNMRMRGRDGLFLGAEDGGVHIENFDWAVGSSVLSNDNAKQGPTYMNHVFSLMGPVNRSMSGTSNTYNRGPVGSGGRNTTADEMNLTHIDMEWADYSPRFPDGSLFEGDSNAFGNYQRFPVPKIGRWQINAIVDSRSGLELTMDRAHSTLGDLKPDVGDVFARQPEGTEALRDWTWFVVDSVSGGDFLMRQLNNFDGVSQFNYATNGRIQVSTGEQNGVWHYICTRIRKNPGLIIGDVTSGSAVITNVKFAFSGSGSGLTSDNLRMAAGDYFIHTEIDRGNAAGSLVKSLNLVSAVDTGARTITLTENFNITRTNYPVVFYVKVFNA
jgi:hypothetical protein